MAKKKFSTSYEVCSCRHVSLAEIVYAIKQRNAKTLEDIAKFTDAGVCCKCCVDKSKDNAVEKKDLYLTQILKKFKEE